MGNIINEPALLNRVEDDRELLSEMVAIFFDEYETYLGNIASALKSRSAPDVAMAAHTLKGVLTNFEASAAASIAAKIEKLGKDGELDQASALYPELADETAKAKEALAVYLLK